MKRICFLISFVFFYCFASAQNITPLWVNRFAGSGDNSDRYNKIIPDGSGNYYAVGYTVRDGNSKDFLTAKLNANLDTMWTRTKNGKGNGDDDALAVARDASGNIYVTGLIDGGSTSDDIYTVKYDASGTALWDTAYNDTDSAFLDEMPVAIAVDPSGNVIVAGWTEQGNWTVNQNDYLLLKYDPNGNVLWKFVFNRSGFRDEITAMAVDAAGDIFITGRSSNGTDDDWVTKKVSSAGSVVWTTIYSSGNGDDRPAALILDNSGNPIVAGRWDNSNNDDCRVIEYSSGAGTLQWNRFFNAPNGNDRPTCMTMDPATGDIYVGFQGDGNLTSITDYDIYLEKLNASGVIQWQRNWIGGALADDIPTAIAMDPFGNVLLTGYSDNDPTVGVSNNNWITLKYDPSGNRLYEKTVNGTRNMDDEPYSILSDASGNAIVAGFVNNANHKDATAIQYDAIGNPSFTKYYNGQGDFNESGHALIQDANGNTYIAGYTYAETNHKDILIMKINPSGGFVDTIQFNGTNDDDDELEALAVDGNFLYGCGIIRTDQQKSDYLTVKVNLSPFDTVWTRIFNDSLSQADKAVSIATDGAGNIFVTGLSDRDPNDTTENNDIVTIKYNGSGVQQWMQRYNGASNLTDEPVKLKLGGGNRVYVCGLSENSHDDDIIILAYDQTSGASVAGFPAIFAGPSADDDRLADFMEDASGNIYVAGYSQSSSFVEDYVLVKFNSSGAIQSGFPKFYDGPASQEDKATALALNASGQIVITGQSDADFDPLIKNYNYATLFFDGAGNYLCVDSVPYIYNGTANGDDIPVSVHMNGNVAIVAGQSEEGLPTAKNKNVMIRFYNQALCSSQSYYAEYDGPAGGSESPNATLFAAPAFFVTGSSDGTDGMNDVITLKYDFSTGMEEPEVSQIGSAVYPNPFTDAAAMILDNKSGEALQITIYDVLGNEVRTYEGIRSQTLEIGKESLTSGLYTYRIFAGKKPSGAGKFAIR